MQKKLIALAIASAMTVPALAYAEVNISGQANVSIDMVNDGVEGNSQSANQLNSNQSRVVLKGSDDLGDGLSAMYQLDTRFNVDTGTTGSTFWAGNTFVGLKSSSLGTVMLGRIDSPYKTAFRNLDVFFDVAGDNRAGVGAIGGLLTNDLRLNNVIAYASPDMSGFGVSVASVFGAETPTSAKKGSALVAAATYKMDGIYAALAYQSAKAGASGTGDLGVCAALASCLFAGGAADDESKAFKLGGGYTMDAFTVNAAVEMPTYTYASGGEHKQTNFYIAGTFAVNASDKVKLAYTLSGESEDLGVKQKDDANQIAVGYDHSMSKATSVYANYVKTTDKAVGAADPSVLSFGVKHAF